MIMCTHGILNGYPKCIVLYVLQEQRSSSQLAKTCSEHKAREKHKTLNTRQEQGHKPL